MIVDQGLEGVLRPGAHKGGIRALSIVGRGISGIIPLGNHDGQSSPHAPGHQGTGVRDMRGPRRDPRKTGRLGIGAGTGIFMPANLVWTRIRVFQEILNICLIVLIVDGADKVGVVGNLFQLRHHAIP